MRAPEHYERGISRALPYVLSLPVFRRDTERLTVLLVGSLAAGTWRDGSDIDIAVLCDSETYRALPPEEKWEAGRPSEAEIVGIPLHYYAIPYKKVEDKMRQLDDLYLYVYSTARVLHDPTDAYAIRLEHLTASTPEVKKERLEGKLDMLLRRTRALRDVLKDADLFVTASVCLEISALCLKVFALLDDVPFDARKRLFNMCLQGKRGRKAEDQVRGLISDIGELGRLRPIEDFAECRFRVRLERIVSILVNEARDAGYQVGLPSPDHRHVER